MDAIIVETAADLLEESTPAHRRAGGIKRRSHRTEKGRVRRTGRWWWWLLRMGGELPNLCRRGQKEDSDPDLAV
jgi:hypothetical protein